MKNKLILIIGLSLLLSCGTSPKKVKPIDQVRTILDNPGGTANFKSLGMHDVSYPGCLRYVSNIVIDSSLSDTTIDRNIKLAIIEMYKVTGAGKAYSIRAFNKESDKLAFLTADFAPLGDYGKCCDKEYTIDQFELKIWR